MLTKDTGETECLTCMNLGKPTNDGDQFALPRHSEAENGVSRLVAVKGDALDDPL